MLAASLLILAVPSVFAGKTYITKDIKISEFTSIECSLPCDIEYVQGPASFRISATQDILDHLVAAVSDGKLQICLDKTKIFNMGEIKVWISSTKLNEIEVNGSIDVNIKNLETDTFDANMNGTAELNIDGFTAKSACINANGASSTDVKKATCGTLDMRLNGAGDCDLTAIECNNLIVKVNGAGGCDIEGHAKNADLTINGVGGIDIKKFNADTLTTAVNGIGKISRD